MIIIYDKRNTGKTTKLIQLSASLNIPIVISSSEHYLRARADELGLKIPKPILLKEAYKYDKVLIDDADALFKMFIGSKVEAMVINSL